MGPDQPTLEVRDWLARSGWTPGRDIGEQAEELIRVRMQDAERQGVPLTPVPAAVRIVHTFGLLRLDHPTSPRFAWVMKPTIGYEGDAEEIQELASGLGEQLFPVGYEAAEGGLLLVDEKGRFFHLHHTGGYYLGQNEYDAFSRFLLGVDDPDAEDYFV
ncbi:SUKH-3 domain-containing protein [Streptomyces niger]|uniref:SUKH-3 domain-containing protein n=1 Tax=Streptomyces niger TaxID=66373 RepID=UPI00069B0B3C|nr:SUKH-3 domain-containing protein [Streptomyces niger]